MDIQEGISNSGIKYQHTLLSLRKRSGKKAMIKLIPHNTHRDEFYLKIASFKIKDGKQEIIKEINLDEEEFVNLVTFIFMNHNDTLDNLNKEIANSIYHHGRK